MARISVEQKALTDSRFQTLGRLLGIRKYEALGRMILVWHQCQEREVYCLSEDQILDIHPDLSSFANCMIQAGLARPTENGNLYICGTNSRKANEARREKRIEQNS